MNTRTLAKTTLGIITCFMLTAGAGQAATDTWSGGTSGDWTNGANWSLGAAPTSADIARFGYSSQSTVTLGAGLTEVQKMYFYFSGTKTSYNITGAGSGSTTLKINPNTNAGWNLIENLATNGTGINQTFSNLTLLLEDSFTAGQLKITPGVGGITIASNAILKVGSTTAQAVIVEANNSQTGSGTLSINGALTAGVTGSSILVDKSGVLNLNLAAGSDFTNLQLNTAGGGIINFYKGGNLGGSVAVGTNGSVVNLAASGITLGTTAFSMANGGILRTSYGSGTSTLGGQITIASGMGVQTSTFDVATGGTLALTNRLQGVSPSAIVEKTGGGTLALSYSAGTGNSFNASAFNVRAGTLLVNNTGNTTASAAPVNIYSGATLAGSGKITGAVTINSGGTIAPGNSPGTLTVGSLIWNDGGNYNWQLYDATGSAGVAYDTISGAGNLNLSGLSAGGFNINLWTINQPSATNGSALNFNAKGSTNWTLGTFSGGITGFDASKFTINTAATNGTTGFANSFSAGGFNISTNGSGQLLLTYQGVDPASLIWNDGSGNLSTIGTTNGSALVFTGAAGGNVTNNQVSSLSSITFSNTAGAYNSNLNTTGAYNFSGNNLTNGNGGIVNNSAVTQTVSLPLTLGANQSFDAASGNLAISGNVTNNGNTLTLAGASNTTVSGDISGTGGLTKTNAGTATLSGNNMYSGGTTVNGGTLVVGSSTALGYGAAGAGALTVNNGSTLDLGSYTASVGAVTLNSGSIIGSGTLLSYYGFALNGGTINANLGSGVITVATGTTTLGSAGRLATGFNYVTINSGGLNLGGNEYVGAFTNSGGTLGGSGTLFSANGYALNGGTINANLGTGVMTVGGDATLNGTSASTSVAVNSGKFTLGGNDRLSSSAVAAVTNGATLDLGGHSQTLAGLTGSGVVTNSANTLTLNVASGNNTFGGSIKGAGDFTKSGAGAVSLNAAQTFTGKTTVSAGNLILAAGASLASTEINLGTSGQGTLTASSGITIGSGQTLAGYGTLVGNTTIASGGTFAPGNSPGVIGITGDLNLNTGSTSIFEVVSTNAAGVGFDQVNVTGALTYGGVLKLDITGYYNMGTAFQNYLFTAGSMTGAFTSVKYSLNSGTAWNDLTYYAANNTWQMWNNSALTLGADNGYIGINLNTGMLTVVPEPSTYILFGLGALALVIAARRRRA